LTVQFDTVFFTAFSGASKIGGSLSSRQRLRPSMAIPSGRFLEEIFGFSSRAAGPGRVSSTPLSTGLYVQARETRRTRAVGAIGDLHLRRIEIRAGHDPAPFVSVTGSGRSVFRLESRQSVGGGSATVGYRGAQTRPAFDNRNGFLKLHQPRLA